MGLFGKGKKKDKKNEKVTKSKKSLKKSEEDKITAPIIFEEEKVQKILSNIEFEDGYSDFGVKIGEVFGEVTSPKLVSSNRVKLFISLKNYKTNDSIFKSTEGSTGITGKQYKIDCSKFSQMLNCKFISAIEKEYEIARLYALKLYAEDYIEFWRVLQVTALLSGKTDETNLKYWAIFDRLEQAMTAIDVSAEKIAERLKDVIIMSYNQKLSPDSRVQMQLQSFIEEISRDYEISPDTWIVIYKYLNGVIARGFKDKLDSKGIPIGYGFTLEGGIVKKAEKEEVTTVADINEVFQKNSKPVEEDSVLSSTNIFDGEGDISNVSKPEYFDIGGDDSEETEVPEKIGEGLVGFDDYQRDLSKEDNTSEFTFNKVKGDDLIGEPIIICVKMSEMMKAYFNGDSFNAVLRQIYNLNTALNSPHGVESGILQLCSSYNPMELAAEQLDDLIETLNRGDLDIVDFHFTNVLDVLEEIVENRSNRVIFLIYDRIIDKTPSIRKMREMSHVFEKNKIIFVQLDKDAPDNYEELRAKETSLFTNCRHILVTPELASSSIGLGSALRNAFIS